MTGTPEIERSHRRSHERTAMTTETDRELTRLAYRAAFSGAELNDDKDMLKRWAPLTNDGDEARLESKLGMDVDWYPALVLIGPAAGIACAEHFEHHAGDKQSARRRAGVLAAAEIGRNLK